MSPEGSSAAIPQAIPAGSSLAGAWHLEDETGDWQAQIALPGDVISGLHGAGLIPDPYWGRNEYGLRWICERDWTLRRRIRLPGDAGALVLSGLDCVATLRLDGREVLRAANAFRTWRVPVEDLAGREVLAELVLHAAPRAAAALQEAQPFPVPYHAGNSPIANGNMLRKPQCDFGWDWNIALAPMGLWGRMEIEPARALRMGRIEVLQDHGGPGVRVTVRVHPEGQGSAPCTLVLDGQQHKITLTAGEGPAEASFDIAEPRLWWPAGQGGQPLYELTAECAGARETRRIGLRQAELIAGDGFAFRINGRDIFAKGANWIPADALPGRITREGVRALLQSAADAHMNMIRVWGGGRYEPNWFYEICDELGLMVWQDFMFACNLYPSTPDFLSGVDAEVRETVARLAHHPSIVLWCGDNELTGALTWFEESRKDRDRYLVSYDRLNRTIETALQETAPGAPWWPSSPSRGPLDFGDAWHGGNTGDMHFWSVWHEGRDFDHYRDVAPRFCSEFGFQSYPSMEVIRRFAGPEDMNIAAPVLESHQKDAGGNERIAGTMFRYFRFPVGFENFVYVSQLQQGLAIATAVTHWRSLKPLCMGTLYWQLNDTWPVASWSSLDHGGGWKLLHHMARDFYRPLLVTAVPREGGALALMAVNDTGAAQEVTVTLSALSPSGTSRPLGEARASAGPDAAQEITRLPAGALREGELLQFVYSQPGGGSASGLHAPRPWKAFDLRPAGLRCSADWDAAGARLTLEATQAPAFFAAVEPGAPGRLSRNAILVQPGQPQEIRFTPDAAGTRCGFALRDLHSATYGAAS